MTVMSNEFNICVEERYQLCKYLYLIKKETDKRNRIKKERGLKLHKRVDIFALPSHIKKLFGPFLKTPQYTRIASLEGHYGCVKCLTLHENKLYSGSIDGNIRIWDTETYEEIAILRGHTGSVRCLTLHENKLYTGSGDKTIRVWKI